MTLAVEDRGTGPAVVLLHAFPCRGQMWSAQADDLVSRGWRVVVPDLPGFGGSPLPAEAPDLAVTARILLADLSVRGIDTFVLAGISLGGYIAMAILRQSPERVAGLVLVDTKAGADAEPARQGRIDMAARMEAGGSTSVLVAAMLPGLLGDSSRSGRPDVVARVSEWISTSSPAAVAWTQRAMASRPDSFGQLAGYRRPALVIVGEEDVLSPVAEARAMVDELGGQTELIVVPACGHLSCVERPDAVSASLAGFLAGLRPPFDGG